MNPEIKKKWLTALRSGEYKQTAGALKDTSGYCCLGVLCEAAGYTNWQAPTEGDEMSCYGIPFPEKYRDETFEGDGSTCIGNIPEKFMEEIGMTKEENTELISMNDELGVSFEGIATWIEAKM
jgi:hypothetical protein